MSPCLHAFRIIICANAQVDVDLAEDTEIRYVFSLFLFLFPSQIVSSPALYYCAVILIYASIAIVIFHNKFLRHTPREGFFSVRGIPGL